MPSVESEPILSIKNLHVDFSLGGKWLPALRGVDLEILPGQSIALVGESGSGKSITALSTIGLLPRNGRISRGSIHYRGREISSLSESSYRKIRGPEIALVFQDPLASLNPVLSVGLQLTEQMRVHEGIPQRAATARAAELLSRVGIPSPTNSLGKYPFEFSGGMRQRIALAIALSCGPSLIIADEPTTALDVTVQAQILDLLKELTTETGAALMIITHDLAVASMVADHVAVMYAGQVVEVGQQRAMTEIPHHPYTRGLWSAIPNIATGLMPVGIPGLPPRLGQASTGCSFRPRCVFATEVCKESQSMLAVDEEHWVRCVRWDSPELREAKEESSRQ